MSRTSNAAGKPVSLARIETDDHSVDLKLKLRGKLLAELTAYRDAYSEAHGDAVELETLVPQMLATFMASDKAFQAWLKRRGYGREAP